MYQKFGLHSPPFRLTPDPNVFFGSRGHVRAQSYLTFGLSQGEGFVVITGDVGAGKTTLISHLLGSLQEQKYKVARIVTSHLNAEDTLRMIVRAFGLPDAADGSKATLLRQLEQLLVEAAETGERCLLIVDEVQNMPFAALEELRMLSNIEVPNGSSLQTILVGQPEFRKIISGRELRQLRQRVVASCHLSPMEEWEVKDYVLFRLRQVGWVDNPRFSDDVFLEIYRHTDGVPRRINLLCSRLLLLAGLNESNEVTQADVTEVAEELAGETEVTGGGEETENSRDEAAELLRRSSSSDTLSLVGDMRERLTSIETRLQKHDQMFKRFLLFLVEYLTELESGPR
jgi:putative secretion ATPase (PEP-CTERM system associated)